MHNHPQDFSPGHRCVIDLDDPPADVPQELVDAGKKMFAAVFPTDQKGAHPVTPKQLALREHIESGRAAAGLSTDLRQLVRDYRKTSPEYAEQLRKLLGFTAEEVE